MKVLVTGATGFIGSRVVSRLLAEGGCEVVAAARRPGEAPAHAREAVDLLVPGEAQALIKRVRPTHLLHFAWNATPGVFWNAVDNLDWTASSLMLFRAFQEYGGARAVVAGTCAEYDWASGLSRFVEDSPIAPSTLYGVAKNALHQVAEAAAERSGLSLAWGRVFWIYGPGEPLGRLVSDVAHALVEGRPVETGAGLQRRDFLHVDDVAAAFTTALHSEWRGAFNVGSGSAAPVRDIVQIIAEMAGRPNLLRVGARPSVADDPPQIEADTGTLVDRVGYTPSIGLEEGLAQTLRWWRARHSATRELPAP